MMVHKQSARVIKPTWVFQSVEELYWNNCFVQMKAGCSSAGDENMNLARTSQHHGLLR
jgi:hypothetical protein